MSYLSKVIPLVRARSSSPIVGLNHSITTSSTTTTAISRARTPSLRSISPLLSSITDHGLSFGSSSSSSSSSTRGYATAFTSPLDGSLGTINNNGWGNNNKSFVRLMSDLSVPEAPTSSHPHTPIPGATGKLIYTET